MKHTKFQALLLAAIGLGALAPRARAVVVIEWWPACVEGIECLFDYCLCDGDWDDLNNWDDPGSGFPDQSGDRAEFTRSNGPNDNLNPETCDVWDETCGEAFLQVNLPATSVTIGRVLVEVDDTGAGVLDYLFLAFSGEGSSRSVSTDWVTLKGDTGTDKGELVLEVRGNGKIYTY